jgi:hypothetical protein
MNGGVDPAETAAENDDSFLARLIGYRIDHRILSVTKPPVPRRNLNRETNYSGVTRSLFVSSSFASAAPLGPD